jgi:prepilin peptidase CpaA
MDLLNWIFVAIVAAFTMTAAVSDWRTRTLSNWLTVPAMVAGVLMHTVINGLGGLTFAMAGFATGFGFLLILWLIGGGGGGDVKLMGALGAWLGAGLTIHVLLVSTALTAVATGAVLLGGMLSRGFGYVQRRYLASGSTSRPSRRDPEGIEARRRQRQRRRLMPFAVPVALGTWLVLSFELSRLPW